MRVLLWIKKELYHILPIFFFFLLFFTLINEIEAFLFERIGVTPFKFLEIAIAAALIAKIVLIVDHIPLIQLFRKWPLVYIIFWKTSIYWILLFIVRFCIKFSPFWFGQEGSFQEDLNHFFNQVNWNLFLSIQAYYLMLLFLFVTFQELTFKIGPVRMRRLFFGK